MLALPVYLATVRSKWDKIALGLGLGLSLAFCVHLLVIGNALFPKLKSAVMLGRDDSTADSFNGRLGVWEECLYYIDQRPIFGYGYDGFWTQRHITEISETQKWGVAEAHSAYLECLLDLGLVGLAAFVFALVGGIRRSFLFHRASQDAAFAFFGALLTFCVADGFLESAVLLSPLLTFLTMAVLIELEFRRQEFGVRRYLSYVPSRYYRSVVHLQQG
jgi:O-antigen ligase